MSKKTIITILGSITAIISFLPIPLILLQIILLVLGVLIIFFTRAKVSNQKMVQSKDSTQKIRV